MNKIWLASYPTGVPANIDIDEYSSLVDIFERSCEAFAQRPAFSNTGVSISYAELDQLSRNFAAYLQSTAGLERGDRVAVMLPNLLQYPVVVFGLLRAGMVAVNVNPLYTARELEHQLKDSGAKAIVILEIFCHTLEEVLGHTEVSLVIDTRVGDMFPFWKRALVDFLVRRVRKMIPGWKIPQSVPFRQVISDGQWLQFEHVQVGFEDLAFLQYTGGTTGVSKGAMLSHRNLVCNVQQSTAWIGGGSDKQDDVVITALPLYHIFSLTSNCMSFVKQGGHNVLITNPRDFPAFVKELGKHRFTFISGVNTLFNALLNTPGFDKLDFSALRVSLGGGMAVQEAVAREWKAVTGNVLTQAYGLTETSPAATVNPMDLAEFNGSIGLPIPSTEVSIRDEYGTELGIDEVGEICIRGPQVMEGYWQKPEETTRVMFEGGWLRSGDMGRMDAKGFIYIEDRKKDMILVSGFNVYPNEIESIAVEHPGVLEAAAIGIPHEHSGETVKLFVVAKDPNLTEADVIAHCKENLTGYKVPKIVEFRDELPKTNVGKILRRALRDE